MSRMLLCAALAAASLITGSALAAPSITLSPAVNHPSSQVKITGAGFGVNKLIDLYWDATDELLAVSDGTGGFSQSIPVPATALPGTHWVTAGERGSGDGAQASFMVRTDWVEHGFGSRGRRYNPYENVISPANAANLGVAWTYTTGGIVESSPAVAGGIVYIGSNDGYLYALNATTGAKKWRTNAGGVDYSSPAVFGGVVYVGSMAGKIYALNTADGSVKWVYPSSGSLGFNVESSPTVVSNVVYIGADDGNLYALNASTGAKLWSFLTAAGDQVWSAPAVWNGAVYIGSGNKNIYAISTTTHSELWHEATADVVLSSPALANRVVFVGSYDTSFYEIEDNNLVENLCPGSAAILSSPAVANGSVYFGRSDGTFVALDTSLNCTVKWQMAFPIPIHSSPAAANGVIYVGSDGIVDNVIAFDAGAGDVLWYGLTDNSVTSSPAVANGMVYVGSYDHEVYAFALDAGANAAYHRNPARPLFASLHPNGRLKPTN